MQSCAETLIGDDDDITQHHTPINIDEYLSDADNPYPTVEFLPAIVTGGQRWGGITTEGGSVETLRSNKSTLKLIF